MGTEYIHYGSYEFNPNLLVPDSRWQQRPDKPFGLWASPVNSQNSWYDWCMSEDFHVEKLAICFKFVLADGARVLHVRSADDVKKYLIGPGIFYRLSWNYPRLYKDFDAVELHYGNDWGLIQDCEIFWGWDVDSIVIWNPDIVVPVYADAI